VVLYKLWRLFRIKTYLPEAGIQFFLGTTTRMELLPSINHKLLHISLCVCVCVCLAVTCLTCFFLFEEAALERWQEILGFDLLLAFNGSEMCSLHFLVLDTPLDIGNQICKIQGLAISMPFFVGGRLARLGPRHSRN
jgi:TRAP-type C4-dicarboxylate transport system permease small subunit